VRHLARAFDAHHKEIPVARTPSLLLILPVLAGLSTGCSSTHTDRGALTGGLVGAGAGAIAGHAMGNTAAGAAIGAGVGVLGGAAIGNSMDQEEERNRAMIAQQLGRPVDPNAVTISDVIAMRRANVNEDLIINHIHAHGMAAPLQTNDLINLPQQGVSSRVIQAMQESPPRQQPVVVQQAPSTVIVREYPPPYYGPSVYIGPRYHHHW
jgi:osmotically inducible lipoprotein OsmB